MVRVQPSLCFFPPPMILFSMEGRGEGAGFLEFVFLVRQVRFSCSWFAKFGFRVPGSPSSSTSSSVFNECLKARGSPRSVLFFGDLNVSMSSSSRSQAQGLQVPSQVVYPSSPLLHSLTHLTDLFLLCLLLCVACMCSKTGPGVGAQGREGLLT